MRFLGVELLNWIMIGFSVFVIVAATLEGFLWFVLAGAAALLLFFIIAFRDYRQWRSAKLRNQ